MKVGIHFPNEFYGSDPLAIRDFAQTAEGLGYSHLLLYDHVLGAVLADRNPPLLSPYDERTPFHDPFVLIGYLAGLTDIIEFETGVLVLPQRQTAVVAKQAAEAAILSNNRLRLGVGVGHNFVEYQGLNASFADRGSRIEEQILVLRQLWTLPVVDFHGEWHELERVALAPLPTMPIPIWMGGFSDTVFRRAAKIADGFVYVVLDSGGESSESRIAVRRLFDYTEAAGRERHSFGIDAFVAQGISVSDFAKLVECWSDLGVSHMTLHFPPGQYSTGAEHIAALAAYMRAIS